MIVIGLCGYTGAGKSTVAEIIYSTYKSVQVLSTGDIVRNLMRKENIELNHINMQMFNNLIHKKLKDNYIKIVYDFIDYDKKIIIIDSLRTPSDRAKLKSDFKNFILIGILSKDVLRFKRVINRKRKTDIRSKKDFMELKNIELVGGVEKLIKFTDLTIENNYINIDDFKKNTLDKVDYYFRKYLYFATHSK